MKRVGELGSLDGMDDAWLMMAISLRREEWREGEAMYSSYVHVYGEEGIKVLTSTSLALFVVNPGRKRKQ